MTLTYDAIAAACQIPADFAPFRQAADAPPFDFSHAALASAVHELALSAEITAALANALSELHANSALRALAAIAAKAIQDHPGERLNWPLLPSASGPAGELFYALVFLSLLPFTRQRHADRQIPEAITRATLSDLPRWLQRAKHLHGRFACTSPRWLARIFTGTVFALGRLQFEMRTFYLPTPVTAGGLTLQPGDKILSMHIPEGGPLTPAAVDESLHHAADFFPRYFPDWPYRAMICESWLLSPGLGAYLPAESNLTHFRNRFALAGVVQESEEEILDWLFDGATRDTLPRQTSLQRAIADAMARGEHFPDGLGILRPTP